MKKYFIPLAFVFLAGSISAFAQEKTSLDYLREGSTYYLTRDYQKAIPPYQKALELEKKEQKLERKEWLLLIDNLGIAYGVTSDFSSSQAVFLYGIKKEPTFPMFYYNMACGYGELGAVDDAIDYLRKAYKYKDNMIEGETFPDPVRDGSFEEVMKVEKFRKAVEAMKAGK